jgi:DNA polymerase (family 10)
MRNHEIADLLERMGTLLEIKGELIFKIKAHFKAAENIRHWPEDIEVVKAEKRLCEIPGVGRTLEEKVVQYLDTGSLEAYENLIKEVPESLLEVVSVPSVGPKKAKLFYEKLGIKNITGLLEAAQGGQLTGLPGVKEKTIENILKGIRVVQAGRERMNLGVATRVAEECVAALKGLPEVENISTAGSLRRGCETVRDIDILISSPSPAKVMDVFVRLPRVKSVQAHGETKSSVLIGDNIQVDLRVVDAESFGAALLYFTGSTNFNIKLRQRAIKKEMKVNEYGVFSVKGSTEKLLARTTEEECLRALGLPYIVPELREDMGEAEIFGRDAGFCPPALVELTDIKGDLHAHSTWSDGRNTIAEMAEAAQKRGYQYLAVSDHSPKLRVAGGVSPENLKKKKREIDQLNTGLKGFRVLFGTEVEIDTDGNLDYNSAILSEFDIVVAAIHSGFEQGREQLTRRLVKACQSKYVNIIAHPMGARGGKRDPYDIDFKEVCRAAVDNRVFLEVNSSPARLDLNSSNVFFAKGRGVSFVINTDAHHVDHMGFMKFGVTIARRGWLTKTDVLNTLTLPQLLKAIQKK